MPLKPNKGTYCLVARLDRDEDICIGARPAIRFPRGFYCYVGSAMNNLEKRIERHLSPAKKFHWHIDFFLTRASVVNVLSVRSLERLECAVSRELADSAGPAVMPGFGSSDCSCRTHLHFFTKDPTGPARRIMKRHKP